MPSRKDGSEYIVHDVHTSCQLDNPASGDSSRISLPGQRTNTPTTAPQTALRVAPNAQWLSTTTGRIATCGHSWMTAIHWIASSGLYTPSRSHGPKWGPTTVLIAQELANLTECRPGIAYLARKLKVSERTIQYHLDMLREAGLLAYRTKGSRITGSIRQASVYERIIPAEFDQALGIRTVGEGVQRRPVGIAEESRTTIGKLAKKAARKVRRARSRKPSARRQRCTPMQGGTSAISSAGTTTYPPESKLASGTSDCPTPKIPKQTRRSLNRVGRRYQLGRELVAQVPWLGDAATARIAWVAREVADAGWSADEVRAYLDTFALGPADGMRRPTGVLARRLKGAVRLLATPKARQECLQAWRDSQQAARSEHAKGYETLGAGPGAVSVQALVDEAFRRVDAQQHGAVDTVLFEVAEDSQGGLASLSNDELVRLRSAAYANPEEIGEAIDLFGEETARFLYTDAAVNHYRATRGASRV